MKPEERFAELWTDYLEGALEEAGHAELRALLANDDSLQKRAADLFQMHRMLGFAAAANPSDAERFVQATLARVPRSTEAFVQGVMKQVQKAEPAGSKVVPFEPAAEAQAMTARAWHRREWLAAAATFAVSATGGALWWRHRTQTMTLARVTQNAGAVLVQSGQTLAIGETLPHGRLMLARGALGLHYGRGVQLVIEAPAEFECSRADLLRLYAGRVAAEVPPLAKGFTVITPTGKAVDLGTKFGVDVPPQGEAEVHVFQGEVIAQSSGGGKRQSLRDGEAFALQSGAGNPRELRSAAFIRPEEVSSLHAALVAGQQAYSDAALVALRNDPALIAMFDFESDGLPSGSYRVVQGRWPGSHAPEFVNVGDHMKIDIGGNREWPQLTLAAWVRLDRLGAPYQSLIHTDGWSNDNPGQVHWMVTRKTTMRLALRGNTLAPGFEDREGHPDSRTAVLPEQGRWVHLASVYDCAERSVRFYLNGEFDNEVLQEIAYPARLGPAQIGNWDKQDRKLSGRIDEMVVLGRALGGNEVRALYAAGNPYR
ncbi:MAG TPA: LamG-like jellyroll fold domain-containing protein [Chthoniobacter sp.]|nr:LamG-like jellyroll fold domain-containing protein [Chthoniobacter sp.]